MGTAVYLISTPVEDIKPGDRLPSGGLIEEVQHVRIGPDWIVAAWVKGADYDGTGLPTITWPVGAEVQIQVKEDA